MIRLDITAMGRCDRAKRLILLVFIVDRTSQIIRKAKKRKSLRPSWTKEQDGRYRDLVTQLESKGFQVRREELKRGHCWKVVSGSCRSQSQKFIFVDSRLSPQEQISFLEAQLVDDPNLQGSEEQVSQAA